MVKRGINFHHSDNQQFRWVGVKSYVKQKTINSFLNIPVMLRVGAPLSTVPKKYDSATHMWARLCTTVNYRRQIIVRDQFIKLYSPGRHSKREKESLRIVEGGPSGHRANNSGTSNSSFSVLDSGGGQSATSGDKYSMAKVKKDQEPYINERGMRNKCILRLYFLFFLIRL